MNRLNLIALAILTVAGNVAAMEQKPAESAQPVVEAPTVGKMQRAKDAVVAAKDAVVAGAQVAAGKVAEYKKTAIAGTVASTGALVVADRKFNNGRATNFAMHQAVRLVNAVMANKSTSAKLAVATAVLGYLGKLVYNEKQEGRSFSQIVDRARFELKKSLVAALAASSIAGHVYGDSVVAGVKSVGTAAWNKAKAIEYAKLFNYLKTLGASFANTRLAQYVATSRAAKAVVAHPYVAGAVTAAAVAAPVVYKTGLVGKLKARFAKPAVDVEQSDSSDETETAQ